MKVLYKDTSKYLFTSFICTAISFITLPVYTRYLTPVDYGIVALFLLFANVSSGLISVGIHKATYRYYFKFKDDMDTFINLHSSNVLFLFTVFLLSGIIIYHLADWFSSTLFDNKIGGTLIKWSFLSGCMQYVFIYFTALLTAQEKPIVFGLITVLQMLLNVFFSLYLIFQHSLTYLAKIYGTLMAQGIIMIILIIIFRNFFIFRFSLSNFKISIRFSYPQIPGNIINLAYESFDKVMLNKFTGLESLTHYTFGAKFAMPIKMIMDSFARTWNPFFMNTAKNNNGEAKKIIVSHFFEMVFFIMVLGLCIIYFSEEMLRLLTTEEYYQSIYVVPIYVLYYLIGSVGYFALPQIMHGEKMIYTLPVSILNIVINIILNIMLIPKFGAIGAVIATTIAALGTGVLKFHLGQRAYTLPIDRGKFFGLFLIVTLFTLFIYPILMLNISFIIKGIMKVVILLIFIILGIKLNYVSGKRIRMKLIKPIVTYFH